MAFKLILKKYCFPFLKICKKEDMKINIVLNNKLVKKAYDLTGIKNKKDLITEALKLLIRQKPRKSLLDLFGKIKFADSYNYKKMRR